jgi:hypothetical protein
MTEGSVLAENLIKTITRHTSPTRGFFVYIGGNMTVNKFYLKQAVYQVEVDGVESALLMDYADNKYEVIGQRSSKIEEIASLMLGKKHAVNFAYKFNGKIKEENL